jgi:hypothetical protein
MSWLGKVFPYVGFLEGQVKELQVVNQRLIDQLLRVTGNEAIYDLGPATLRLASGQAGQASDPSAAVPSGRRGGLRASRAGERPVKTRQTMEEYLRRLEAEERKLLQEELTAMAKSSQVV